MKTVTRREALAAGAVSFAGLSGVALAQPGTPPGGAPGMMAGQDPVLASCLLIAGRRQIEICKWAMGMPMTDDCKAFAQAEIDEHETIKRKLQQLGFTYPQFPAQQPGTGVVRAGGVAVGRTMLPPGVAECVMIDHEVADQCIATAKAEMSNKPGAKFDKAFISGQLHAHYGLFDHAVVFRKHASPQLAAVLDEGKPVIERHIATCKGLKEKFEAMKHEG